METRRGKILVFIIRPGSFNELKKSLVASYEAEFSNFYKTVQARVSEQNLVLGNFCMVDIFVGLLATGHATAEASLNHLPSPHTAVRDEQLNQGHLFTDLFSKEVINKLSVAGMLYQVRGLKLGNALTGKL
jgi:hypothetical protein